MSPKGIIAIVLLVILIAASVLLIINQPEYLDEANALSIYQNDRMIALYVFDGTIDSLEKYMVQKISYDELQDRLLVYQYIHNKQQAYLNTLPKVKLNDKNKKMFEAINRLDFAKGSITRLLDQFISREVDPEDMVSIIAIEHQKFREHLTGYYDYLSQYYLQN